MPDPMTLDEAREVLECVTRNHPAYISVPRVLALLEAQAAEIERLKANADEYEAQLAQRHEEAVANAVRIEELEGGAAWLGDRINEALRVVNAEEATGWSRDQLGAGIGRVTYAHQMRVGQLLARIAELERGDFEGRAVCHYNGGTVFVSLSPDKAQAFLDRIIWPTGAHRIRRFVARFVEEG